MAVVGEGLIYNRVDLCQCAKCEVGRTESHVSTIQPGNKLPQRKKYEEGNPDLAVYHIKKNLKDRTRI